MSSEMNCSVIAIGNPGVGKSTILNSLANHLMFKSGVVPDLRGSSLTYKLEKRSNERGEFQK